MKSHEPPPPSPQQPRDSRLTAINFVADAVNRTLDIKEIADNALHAILATMKLDAGVVYIWQDEDEALKLFAWRGISEAFARQVNTVPRNADETIDAVLAGDTRVIEDFALAQNFFRVNVVRAGFRSAVLTPIRTQGFVVGLLALGNYRPHAFSRDEIDLIEVVTNQIGNAMVHAQLQSDLRASEEQYRSLVENSDDAIFITGREGRPRFANPAFERLLGYSVEELASFDAFARVHPEDLEAVRQTVERLLADRPAQSVQYRFQRSDGGWIVLEGTASVFSREGGRVKELQFVMRDVTQARQRQEQLMRRNRQLAALSMLAEVANSSLKIDDIARNTLEVALESTGMEGGAVQLADAAHTQLELYLQTGLPEELVAELKTVRWGESLSGAVAATGQPRVSTDIAAEGAGVRPAAVRHGFKSIIIVPVKAKGEMLGTLGLVSRKELAFTPAVIEMVQAMGSQFGIALANARLYEAQLRENEKLNALLEISSGTTQQLEWKSLLQRILRKAAGLLQADGAYMVRYHTAGDEAEVVAATSAFEELIGRRYHASLGLFGQIRAMRQGRIFSRDEITQHGHSPVLRATELRSVLLVPLISRNELIGALGLVRRVEATSDFTRENLELMEAFASRAAVAIDNAQLLEDLQAKNDLLQLLIEEAHHRIKNNLQMISGLLQLQAEVGPTEGAWAEHLHTAISRIQAIAQVHNLLSQEMPQNVDAHLLIQTIVDSLATSGATRGRPPEIATELDHVWLSSEQAVALALIVNELLANALLHGRPPEGQPLRLRVRCVQEDHEMALTVSDNGGGLRGEKTGGQGMNIVAQLAQVNLRGALEIGNRDGGVCAQLRFAIAPLPAEVPGGSGQRFAEAGA